MNKSKTQNKKSGNHRQICLLFVIIRLIDGVEDALIQFRLALINMSRPEELDQNRKEKKRKEQTSWMDFESS